MAVINIDGIIIKIWKWVCTCYGVHEVQFVVYVSRLFLGQICHASPQQHYIWRSQTETTGTIDTELGAYTCLPCRRRPKYS